MSFSGQIKLERHAMHELDAVNKNTYEKSNVVDIYAQRNKLQPPERKIFRILKPKLSTMKMLDIGIGAGRTTSYFAPLVKEYTGVDYSKSMIDYCKKRFKSNSNYKFEIADSRSLKLFEDKYYDFVLFSFNGMDFILPEEREMAFKEMERVCKSNGTICFSSHNLLSVGRAHIYWRNPKSILAGLQPLMNKEKINTIATNDIVIRDGGEGINNNLKICYINPSIQLKYLKDKGYYDIKMFNLNGFEIANLRKVCKCTDPWLYYLYKIR